MSGQLEVRLGDPEAQLAFGETLGRFLPRCLVVYLEGDLGTGKTTLVRGILRSLGHLGSVRSPTYTLIEPYELDRARVYHLDLYRLSDPEELEYLGLRDLSGEDSLLLVEWPGRGTGALAAPDLIVRIGYQGSGRLLTLSAQSAPGAGVIDSVAADSQVSGPAPIR